MDYVEIHSSWTCSISQMGSGFSAILLPHSHLPQHLPCLRLRIIIKNRLCLMARYSATSLQLPQVEDFFQMFQHRHFLEMWVILIHFLVAIMVQGFCSKILLWISKHQSHYLVVGSLLDLSVPLQKKIKEIVNSLKKPKKWWWIRARVQWSMIMEDKMTS